MVQKSSLKCKLCNGEIKMAGDHKRYWIEESNTPSNTPSTTTSSTSTTPPTMTQKDDSHTEFPLKKRICVDCYEKELASQVMVRGKFFFSLFNSIH